MWLGGGKNAVLMLTNNILHPNDAYLGAKSDTTTDEQGGYAGSATCVTSSLLCIGLLTTTAHFHAGLSAGVSLSN